MYKYQTNVPRQRKKSAESGRRTKREVCARHFGKHCKHCVEVQRLYNTDDEADGKIASRCRARSTFYMNIVDALDQEAGNQVYPCGIENWRTMIDFFPEDDDDEEGVDFTNPLDARMVIIKRRGKGLGTKYTLSVGTKKFKMKKKWLENMHPLHNILDLLEKEGDVSEFTPVADQTNKVIVLPPWGEEAEGDFYYEVPYHWNTELLDTGEEGDEDEGSDLEEGEDQFIDEDEEDDIPI